MKTSTVEGGRMMGWTTSRSRSCWALTIIMLLSLSFGTLADPVANTTNKTAHNYTTEELETMSKELQKEEMAAMMNDVEKYKITLANPRSNATEKVEAATKLKQIYETTRLDLYKSNFKEALRGVLVAVDEKASLGCGDMGVHRFNIEDKWLKENCKRALKMVWGLMLAEYLKKPEPPFGDIKAKAHAYLLQRLAYSERKAGSTN